MRLPLPWRAAAFAKKRMVASTSACGGSDSHVASQMSERFSKAEYPLRSGLWHPLKVSLPPRPPPSGGLQHGLGPAGCAVLLKARFDRRLDCFLSGDVGGAEGCAADRASAMLEPPLGGGRVPQLQSALRQIGRHEEAELCEAAAGGPGERHVQRMPESRRRDLRTSGLSNPGDIAAALIKVRPVLVCKRSASQPTDNQDASPGKLRVPLLRQQQAPTGNRGAHALSKIAAIPWPPPMHIVSSP